MYFYCSVAVSYPVFIWGHSYLVVYTIEMGFHSLINMSAFLCRIPMCISVIGKSLWSRGNFRVKIFSWIKFLVNMSTFLCIIMIGAILSENWWTSRIKCLFLKYKVGGFLLEHWIPAWQNEFIAFHQNIRFVSPQIVYHKACWCAAVWWFFMCPWGFCHLLCVCYPLFFGYQFPFQKFIAGCQCPISIVCIVNVVAQVWKVADTLLFWWNRFWEKLSFLRVCNGGIKGLGLMESLWVKIEVNAWLRKLEISCQKFWTADGCRDFGLFEWWISIEKS